MSKHFHINLAAGISGLIIGVLLPAPWHKDRAPADAGGRSTSPAQKRERNAPNAWEPTGTMGADSPRRSREARANRETASENSAIVGVSLERIRELGAATGERIAGDRLFSESPAERMLEVTEQEKTQLQTEWDQTRENLRAAEVAAMRFEESEDGTVKIVLPAAPAGYQQTMQRFSKQVLDVLGTQRGEAFLALKQMDSMFQPAESEQTYQVKSESKGSGDWRFNITLDGHEGRKVWVSDTIPDEISHLTDAAGIQRKLIE